ncbi:methyltransferase domain-containing protein [Candidatus Uhrbacteria bacterium]|nr:methyltransferase domain-containing protein [Candidatus Uhrbacteria bacterium]
MFALTRGRANLDPYPLLRMAGVGLGSRYVDLGCGGTGHFLFPAAHLCGEEGWCCGVEVDLRPLEHLHREICRRNQSNVRVVRGDAERLGGVPIADGTADVISVVHIMDGLSQPQQAFSEWRRLLGARGKLLVVEWNPRGRAMMMQGLERARKGLEGLGDRGFELVGVLPAGRYHEAFLFERVF